MEMDGFIEPNSFDLIVLGTGFPESILAAAAANAGCSVLHLDHQDFYGAHWTSLTLPQFRTWAAAGGSFDPPPASPKEQDSGVSITSSGSVLESAGDLKSSDKSSADSFVDQSNGKVNEEISNPSAQDPREIGLETIEVKYDNDLYSDVQLREVEGADLGALRFYNLDLSGPRLTFCGSHLVNLLLRSGANHYVEFKGVDATYLWTGTVLSAVPSSRADIFKDKSLSLSDKRFLMRFFRLVTDHANGEGAEIPKETLDSPFVEFMRLQNLPASMQSIILYAIALVDTDQFDESSPYRLTTEDGFRKLTLYLSSVGKFTNAPTAFLYPLYGAGELPQAFCRSSAVNGALYVLRRPIKAVLVDKETSECRGVHTLNGQSLYCKKLIVGPSVVPTSGPEGGLPSLAKEISHSVDAPVEAASVKSSLGEAYTKVARYICITDKSLFEGQTTLLVIFPPKTISVNQSAVVRAMQLSNAAAVCPDGKYLLQLSTLCSDAADGEEILKTAVDILLARPDEQKSVTPETNEESYLSSSPKVLWSVAFKQALQTESKKLTRLGIAVCDLPNGALDCEGVLTATEKIFTECFPDTEFFKKVVRPQEDEFEEFDEEVEASAEEEQNTATDSLQKPVPAKDGDSKQQNMEGEALEEKALSEEEEKAKAEDS
ncbi:hypothetical protein R1flu_007090 [Riccia fluitans]|uniref:Rab escort protein 1 n=1 Tax=Riccia fluitans TaxID=41844 RepID=A0ABD1YXV5_9MARC